jgi:hypothetical protein
VKGFPRYLVCAASVAAIALSCGPKKDPISPPVHGSDCTETGWPQFPKYDVVPPAPPCTGAGCNNPSPISAPVAIIIPIQQRALVGTILTLDGSTSYDPGYYSITYKWTEDQSNPQQGLLSSQSADAPIVKPTLPGGYIFQLVVKNSEGVESAPVKTLLVVDTRYNATPVATLRVSADSSSFQQAGYSKSITSVSWIQKVWLDASLSYDLDTTDSIGFIWTQVSGPPVEFLPSGSHAQPSTNSQPYFIGPAMAGTIVVSLVVSDGKALSAPATAVINVFRDLSRAVFVDSSFTGNSIGSISAPYKTISDAMPLAVPPSGPKDIYIARGTYSEPVTVRDGVGIFGGYMNSSGNWSRDTANYATIINNPQALPVPGAPARAIGSTIVVSNPNNYSYCHVDGIRVTGAGMADHSIQAPQSFGIWAETSFAVIAGNRIHGGFAYSPSLAAFSAGIVVTNSSPYVMRNVVDGGEPADGAGTQSSSSGVITFNSSPRISGNAIWGGKSNHVATGLTVSSESVPWIYNNTIYGSGTNPGAVTSVGILVTATAGQYQVKIINNIINPGYAGGDGTNRFGIFEGCQNCLYYDSNKPNQSAYVYNNDIWGADPLSTLYYEWTGPVLIKDIARINYSNGNQLVSPAPSPYHDFNISADPRLSSDGIHLLSYSPCIDAGRSVDEFYDIDTKRRPTAYYITDQNPLDPAANIFDMGADEYE